ncbi:tellurite resistance/C4-dicarboxylate transporter family protein [Streptomyces sp. NPDC059477]|uniref:tellurite resistance/C4-dicarboxylate transporter family protein n=1 Tax=Streptomyces sp. NPDC059477 TaxID=3346847 RepID=UPI0036AEFAEF
MSTSGTSSLSAWWARRPPVAGAAVLATGIVSVGLRSAGHEVLSAIVLVVAGVAWLVLAADCVTRLLRDRASGPTEAWTPDALTAVAATTVVGTGLSAQNWQPLAEALLAPAALVWPVLIVIVVTHWRERMPGTVFLGCVATQGLAVLGATLAKAEGVAWLGHTAMVLFWLGLVLYALALTRFDMRQVWEGAGDHWIAVGALALSALAGSRLIAANGPDLYLWNSDDNGVLRTVTGAVLILAVAAYVVLLVAEVARPGTRLRAYDVRRWATVFAMGTTAAAMLSVGIAMDISWLATPAEVLLWVAVAAWLAVAAGAAGGAWRAVRSTGRR